MKIRKIPEEIVRKNWRNAERMAELYVRPTKKYADYVVINNII